MCSLWWESTPGPAGGFQWWPHPLCAILQWCLISKAIQAAFRSIPSCGVPHSCPLRLSLNSQQWYSSWICFQHLMLLHSTLISIGSFLGAEGCSWRKLWHGQCTWTFQVLHSRGFGLKDWWACSDGCPSQCPWRQGLVGQGEVCHSGSASCMPLNNGTLLLECPELLLKTCLIVELLTVVPSQPAGVPSLGSLSKPHCTAPSPSPYQETHSWGGGAEGYSTDHACTVLTFSCLPQIGCCIPLWSSEGPFLP